MHRLAFPVIVGLFFMPPFALRANDSSAEFETGALRFQRDPDISMRAEDLAISAKRVAISYTFFNQSPRAKTILVAFPMPDIVGADSNDELAVPTDNADNVFDFKVTSDGAPVPLHLEQKALARGLDQTARLRQLHIPLMPIAAETDKALDRLPKADRADLVRLGIARIENYGTGDAPTEDHLVANWTLQSAFTWTQTFPAMRAVVLDQSYRPSVGSSAQTRIGTSNWKSLPGSARYIRRFCIDPSIVGSVQRAMRSKKIDYPPFGEQRIAYILKTGANWAGPIEMFHLTVDKGDAANLLSFCGDSVVKTGPTKFEVHKHNFVPRDDLSILILLPTS